MQFCTTNRRERVSCVNTTTTFLFDFFIISPKYVSGDVQALPLSCCPIRHKTCCIYGGISLTRHVINLVVQAVVVHYEITHSSRMIEAKRMQSGSFMHNQRILIDCESAGR